MRLAPLFFLAASVWAQSEGVTATSSRTVTFTPDEARFAVDVVGPYANTLAQALQVLDGTGAQASDLVGQSVSSQTNYPNQATVTTTYSFAFSRTADVYQALAGKLNTLMNSPPAGYALRVGSSLGPSAGAVEDMRRTLIPALISDAKKKAQSLAAASGVTLGAVKAVSDASDSSTSSTFVTTYSATSEFRVMYSLTVRFAAQ